MATSFRLTVFETWKRSDSGDRNVFQRKLPGRNHTPIPPGKICKRVRTMQSDNWTLSASLVNKTTRREPNQKTQESFRLLEGSKSRTTVAPMIRLLIVLAMTVLFRWSTEAQNLTFLRSPSPSVTWREPFRISFAGHSDSQGNSVQIPSYILLQPRKRQFDGLHLFQPSNKRSFRSDKHPLPRKIQYPSFSSSDQAESYLFEDEFDSDFEPKYAQDDDYLAEYFWDTAEKSASDDCRRTVVNQLHFPTCNSFHEMNLIESQLRYLGFPHHSTGPYFSRSKGTFRMAGVVSHLIDPSIETVVLKHIHLGGFQVRNDQHGNYEKMYRDLYWMRMDAVVAERLSASTRIYDIYGYCGLSILSELFRHGNIEDVLYPYYDSDDDSSDDVGVAGNDLLQRQKLKLALNLAEAVADLHGYSGGAIAHQDLAPTQFMWSKDRSMVKLNDFNRAEIMLWNDSSGRYCNYKEPDFRNYRSPEEARRSEQNEQVDVYNLSSIFYAILTGRRPLDDAVNKERSKLGGKLVIPERLWKSSREEAVLADLINRCRERKPSRRPSIFDVVKILRRNLVDHQS
ncbi:serine/threonine protein kinase [Nitzschia inconspicua]|uniref:Serine/threonine protein kinase n=1 Tax=Nitzschia inconspicua TaxID=303405 RepID=A0A9K3LMF7_9STRA|nr:serine/threonine protein kinase [Nitzschia inconspicua]